MATVGQILYAKNNLGQGRLYDASGNSVTLGNGLTAQNGPLEAAYTVDSIDGSGNPTKITPVGGSSIGSTSSTPTFTDPGYLPITLVSSTTKEASRVAKASAGSLFRFSVYNDSATPGFIHVYNSTTVPADGAIPTMTPVPIGANSYVNVSLENPFTFSNGISLAYSTTFGTKTLGAANCWFEIGII